MAQTVKNLPTMRETWFHPGVPKIPCRKEWQPTPVFLPGESHEQRSLAGCNPWGLKELDTTEQLKHTLYLRERGVSVLFCRCYSVAKSCHTLCILWTPCLSLTPRSLPKFMSIELVMLSNLLILCCPLLLLPSMSYD